MAQPKVSVIIPYSKPDRIDGALKRLFSQKYSPRRLEVIVVGKDSRRLKKKWPIKAIDQGPIIQPGKARNLGAAKASGEIFLFLDDDCRPQPDWLKENLKELKKPKMGAVGGMVSGISDGYFARCFDFTAFSQYQIKRRRQIHIPGATMGVRRDVFQEVGGFDETLRKVEDGDFCYRLVKKGYQVVYQPKIKVLHDHGRERLKDFLTYTHSSGRLAGLIMEKRYPGLSLRFRLFSLVAHAWLYPFMIGPVALLATLVMVAVNLEEHPQVLFYAPFIFLGQLFYHFGVWQWLLTKEKK